MNYYADKAICPNCDPAHYGDGINEYGETCHSCGGSNYIKKPVQFDTAIQTIERINTSRSFDYDYYDRLKELASLIKHHPTSKMKSLQKSALRAYPVSSKELYRNYMGSNFALSAANLANKLGEV